MNHENEMLAFRDLPKKIVCPVCDRLLCKADAKDETLHKLKCKKCGKWIWFVPATGRCDVKEVPERKASGGKRFY